MLDFMRKNANSGIMILLFGVIIFVFAINFGPWAGRSMSETPYAALVDSDMISMSNFRVAYSNQINRLKQFRPEYSESQAEKDGLKRIILDHLITNQLMYQVGKKHHFTVAARVLADQIRDRVFSPEENFSKDEYKKRVEGFLQMSLAQFEEQVSKDIISEQVSKLLFSGIYVSDQEAKEAFLEQNNKVALEFIKVKPAFFKVETKPTDDQVAAFISTNNEKIETYYKENLSQYKKDEQVKASHILIKISDKDTEEDKKTKKQKIESILERLKKNEDFAAIAKAESEDPGTKFKGGDLGYFTKDAMVEAFSKVAFSLKTGELSDIVESPFGFHIIKVIDKKEAQDTPLSEAKISIAQNLIQTQEQKQKATDLANKALAMLKNGDPIESIKLPGLINKKTKGEESKMAIDEPVADETSEFTQVTNYVPKIGLVPEIVEAAFKLSLENKTAQKLVESKDAIYAIRLKSKQEADLSKFEEQKEKVKGTFSAQRKNHYFEQYISYLKSKAKIKINDNLSAPDNA